jgi:hypothetical protein
MITVEEMIASDDFSQIKPDSKIYMADFIRLTGCRHGVYGQYNVTESGIRAKDFGNAYDIASTDDVLILSDFNQSAKLAFPTSALALVQWAKKQGGDFSLSESFVNFVSTLEASAIEALHEDRNVDLKPQSTITNHKLSNDRSDSLSAVITLAANNAVNRNDVNSVWAALVALANLKDKPSPLISPSEDDIKYLKGDEAAFFTKKNHSDRMYRTRKKTR